MYPCTHTQTHAHTGFGADEGGKKLNTHGLFCSLSCCLSFFLHPLWRWWCCWCWHWLCVCLYVCLFVVCAWKRFPACACLIIFVTSSVVWSCVCVCVWVRVCVGACACVCLPVICLTLVCACLCVRTSVCVPVSCSMVASPWSVFLLSGSAARPCGQALHHAGQRWASPERPG